MSEAQAEALLGAAAPFRDAYLAAALRRLNDGVAAAFPGGTRPLPAAADLQKCIGSAPRLICLAASCSRSTLELGRLSIVHPRNLRAAAFRPHCTPPQALELSRHPC